MIKREIGEGCARVTRLNTTKESREKRKKDGK